VRSKVDWSFTRIAKTATLAAWPSGPAGGAAEAGYAERSETIFGAGPVLRASAAARLTDWYLLRLELLAAITTPRAVLRFADREVATWGRPFLQLTLGAEFGLLRPTQS
jgi:hypothetical protein